MSDVIDMVDAADNKRRPKSFDAASQASDGDNTNFSYRLFLIVDLAVYNWIVTLKDVLESPSFGDVVRQAVRAYAIALAETDKVENIDELPVETNPNGKLKKLNIRIPNRTKQRLDVLKEITNSTYTDIVVLGLGILARTAKEQEEILASLENGENTHEISYIQKA